MGRILKQHETFTWRYNRAHSTHTVDSNKELEKANQFRKGPPFQQKSILFVLIREFSGFSAIKWYKQTRDQDGHGQRVNALPL